MSYIVLKKQQHSKTNKKLHDSSTLLYTFGDLYIVDEIIREIQK